MSLSPATTAHATIGHYLNGRVTVAKPARSQEVFNPATGAVSGHVALASAADVDAAVAADRKSVV